VFTGSLQQAQITGVYSVHWPIQFVRCLCSFTQLAILWGRRIE